MPKSTAPQPEEAALCMTALALDGEGKAPREIKLLPFGNPIPTRDGRGPYILTDRAHAERVIASSKARLAGCDFVLDYDHQSALAAVEGVGGQAKAAAWGKALEVRDDGIWLTGVEFTPAGEAALAAREYRYLSPWFYVDKATRLVTWIRNAGLTNLPNIDLPALAHQVSGAPAGEVPDMSKITLALASLATALAIPAEGLDEAKVLAAIDQLKAGKDGAEAALASVRTDLGLAADADGETVLAAVQTAKAAGAPDPTKYVPKDGFDQLQARLTALEEDKVLASVDKAVIDGKIPPSMKDWAVSLGKKDPGELAAYIDKAVPFGGGGQINGNPQPKKGELSAEERAICSMTGVSEAEFLKTRDEEAA